MNSFGRVAFAAIAMSVTFGAGVSAETLTRGALLCPKAAHMALMRIAKHAEPEAEPGTAAYERNGRLGIKYNRVVNSRCIVLNSPAEVKPTGRTSDDGEGELSEVVLDSKKYWVSYSEFVIGEQRTEVEDQRKQQ